MYEGTTFGNYVPTFVEENKTREMQQMLAVGFLKLEGRDIKAREAEWVQDGWCPVKGDIE